MARAHHPERRVSGVRDRRQVPGRSGRRDDDHRASALSRIIPCSACRVAWASLSSVARDGKTSTAIYVCPRCGHREERVGTV
jgi:hypothetical protein